MDTKYISVDETAELLNLSDRRVRQLIINGEITALKDKNKWRINTEELMNSDLFLRKSTGNTDRTSEGSPRKISGNNSDKYIITTQQLNKENKHLTEQLAEKDKQISNLQESIDHSMQLQAMLTKQLEQAQLQIEDLSRPKKIWQKLRMVFGS